MSAFGPLFVTSPSAAARQSSTVPLRVLSFESRRAEEMRSLIARHGAAATVAPSMQEVPLADNEAVFRFGEELLVGRIDAVVFLTGAGCEATLNALQTRWLLSDVLAFLDQRQIIVRGPKPAAVLKKHGVRVDLKAPEPNTWREVVAAIRQAGDLSGKVIAVQEYGKPNEALYDELRSLGASVWPVPVYRWTLPDDVAPLQAAIASALNGEFDVFAFTSAQQVENVLTVAGDLDLQERLATAMQRGVIVSIGPTCSEALREHCLPPDLEASPPKMGPMIRLAVEQGRSVLETKGTSNAGDLA